MPRKAIDRRAFLGTSAGAFICTIGGREIAVRSPHGRHEGRRRRAGCRATRAGRADGAVPPRRSPPPAARGASTGSRRARCAWDIAPRAATTGTAHRSAASALPRLRLPADDAPGFAAPARRRASMPGPDAPRRGRRRDRRPLPQRRRAASARRSRCTRTGSATTPTTTAPTSATTRAPAASSSPARSSRTCGRRRPTRSASGPTTTTGPTTCCNTFRGLFGAIVIRERGAKAPDVETRSCSCTALAPPVTGLRTALPGDQRPRLRRQHADDPRPRRPGRRLPRDRAWTTNFHTFHIHGHRWRDAAGAVRGHADASAPTRRSPPGSPRTTPAAGSTTATSSPTRRRDGRLVRRRCVACSPSSRSSPVPTSRGRCRPSPRRSRRPPAASCTSVAAASRPRSTVPGRATRSASGAAPTAGGWRSAARPSAG